MIWWENIGWDLIGKQTDAVVRELANGVRDQLAVLQRTHKREVIGRGGGRVKDDVWTSRTGALRKSYQIDYRYPALSGAYGSESIYARIQEEGSAYLPGGVIKAKDKLLAIPVGKARTRSGGGRPKDYPGLVCIKSKKGNLLLVQKGGRGGFKVLFVLKESVKIPARPTLDVALAKSEEQRDAIMDRALDRATAAAVGVERGKG